MEIIWPAVALVGFIVILLALFFAFKRNKIEEKLYKKTGKHPKGYYMNRWIGVGVAIGVALGIGMDILPLGMGIGLAIGFALGANEENKHEKELRPLTAEEEEMKRKTVYVLLGLMLLGVIAAAALFLAI